MSRAAAQTPGAAGPLARLRARVRQQVLFYLLHFVEGDHSWGQVRMTAGLVGVFVFVAIGRLFEPITALPLLERLVGPAALPDAGLALLELFASFFTRQTLRHALPPILGLAAALYVGATFLRDLLELPNLQLAFKFLKGSLFGGEYPRMTIAEGRAVVADPQTNPMLKVGGPGWVDIKIGSAALFERVAGPSAVLGAGTHFVRRFETLREAFDLREIERVKIDVRVLTKDGIPVVLPEMRARFHIRARELRSESNPYPVMTGAIRRAAYSRKVTAKGLDDWADMVMGSVSGTVTGWIRRKRMDELIPPPRDGGQPEAAAGPPYRQALHDLFKEKENRQRFADMGAEVIWVSVGHIRPDPDVDPDLEAAADPKGRDKIHGQLIDAWKATHVALAHDEIADARGYARWLEEVARAQAQADLILSVTAGLRDAREDGLPMADLITNRLLEYVTGMKLGRGEESPQKAEWLQKLLDAERGTSPPDTPLLPS